MAKVEDGSHPCFPSCRTYRGVNSNTHNELLLQVDVLTTMMEDKVAFFLLQSDIFKAKNRSTIYQFPE